MTFPEEHISNQILLPIVEFAHRRGIDVDPILERLGIDLASLEDINGYVHLKSYVEFLEEAAKWPGQQYLGLYCGRETNQESLGAISFLFMSAMNLNTALIGLSTYLEALQTGTNHSLKLKKDNAIFSYQLSNNNISERRQDAEYSISSVHHLIRKYVGRSFQAKEVHFEHRCPGRLSTYEDIFGANVYFERPTNKLIFDRAALTTSTPPLNKKLHDIITNHLKEKMADKGQMVHYSEKIRRILDSESLEKNLTIGAAAKKLGIRSSQLARKLKAEGASFSSLQLERRMEISKQLLNLETHTISEIAHRLGYAEHTSFTRAFRAYYGETPLGYKKRKTAEHKK